MVFSFFKKPPEKMVARPAAVPRSTSKGSDPVAPPEPAKVEEAASDFSEFTFSEVGQDFQVDEAIDPVDAEAEEASVLFANGQDAAVLAVLENAVHIHKSGSGERLWLMLFDFYRLTGQKSAFETLEIEYARAFEKSPPGWRDKSKTPHKSKELATGSLLFRGDLTGDNDEAFAAVDKHNIASEFELFCGGNSEFLDSIETSTKNLQRYRRRYELFQDFVNNVFGTSINSVPLPVV